MKTRLTVFLLALASLVAATPTIRAQAGLVTATIQSASGGQPYSLGSYQISLVDASGSPLSVSGYQSQFSGRLSSAGLLSLSLFPNAQIQSGSQWSFQVCSAVPSTLATPQPAPVASCFLLPVTITGAGDISSTLNAAAPVFYGCTQWSGSAWAACGSGSYTLPIATTSVLGGIKPDGTTITVNGTTGVASASSSGGPSVKTLFWVPENSGSLASITSSSFTAAVGDLIAVGCFTGSQSTITITTTPSETVNALTIRQAGSGGYERIGWVSVGTAGAHTVTCTPGASDTYQAMVGVDVAGTLATQNATAGSATITAGSWPYGATLITAAMTTTARTFDFFCISPNNFMGNVVPGLVGTSPASVWVDTGAPYSVGSVGVLACGWGVNPLMVGISGSIGANGSPGTSGGTIVGINY